MHFKFTLPALLLTSTTLAMELRMLKRDACSSAGYEDCYAECMPVGANCCSDGSGTYCNSGYDCVTDGCCPEGETCVGGGGTSTYTAYISEETSSEDTGSYSTSSVVYVENPYTTSSANTINYDTTPAVADTTTAAADTTTTASDTTSAAAAGSSATTKTTSSSVSQETSSSPGQPEQQNMAPKSSYMSQLSALALGIFMQVILV
ncbi:hypothetical protein N7540_002207 [Penicillium herquei]|nr:hypothetical protein N7540_002207 [Penicillium herquei]